MGRPTPLHWIEEAEARDVMTAALFDEPQRRRKRARDVLADWLAGLQEWPAAAVPAPLLHVQPVPICRRPPPGRDFTC